MKTLIVTIYLLLFAQYEIFAQTEFELEPAQSMLMTGKGPGQDATINPFDGEDCYAIVQNIGERPFSVRIQYKGKMIKTMPIVKGEVKKIKLLKGHELYLDPNTEGPTKAKVDYEKIKLK